VPYRYFFACGGAVTLRDLDVALACGQRDFLVSVGTSAASHLRALQRVSVVLDSAAWPMHNPKRPPLDAWWQEVRHWRQGPGDYGNLEYAIAYDTIGNAPATARAYAETRDRIFARASDTPIVPVLGYGQAPIGISIELTEGWEGMRPDLVDGDGSYVRPAFALGGLVPQHGSKAAIAWMASVAAVITELVDDGWDEGALGVHVLGSTHLPYLRPLAATGITVRCDTSTPVQQAKAADAALAWGFTDRYGLHRDLLQRSRYARVAFWLCRERDKLGLPWQTPEPAWLEELPNLTPIVKPQQHRLFAA